MAIKWIEGFETYTTISDLARRYATSNVGTGTVFTTGRTTNQALSYNGTALTTPSLGNQATYTVGFAFQREFHQ